MEPYRDDERLADDLRALRPTPRPEFTAELDERAAAGFPRRSRQHRLGAVGSSLASMGDRLRSLGPRRLLLPAGAAALLAVVVASALIATRDRGDGGGSHLAFEAPSATGDAAAGAPEAREPSPQSVAPSPGSVAPATTDSSAEEASGAATEAESLSGGPASSGSAAEVNRASGTYFDGSGTSRGADLTRLGRKARPRAVERSAQLVLGADPADVGEDTSKVFEAVHAHDGIVMRSSSREGKAGVAGARFELLVPSARLSDALAALSAIDEVISRHEATADITAPTVNVTELLQDSKARIDSLLTQLAEAETESEREAVEAELRQERRHRARLRASLQDLQRRADLSRVLVRIETGTAEGSSGSGAWGVDDAVRDAGKVLGVAAAVIVVSLAVIGPIALIALLAWLTHRAWVRRERRRVLG